MSLYCTVYSGAWFKHLPECSEQHREQLLNGKSTQRATAEALRQLNEYLHQKT